MFKVCIHVSIPCMLQALPSFHLTSIMIFHNEYHLSGLLCNFSTPLSLFRLLHWLTFTINIPTLCYQLSPHPPLFQSSKQWLCHRPDDWANVVRFPLVPTVRTSSKAPYNMWYEEHTKLWDVSEQSHSWPCSHQGAILGGFNQLTPGKTPWVPTE